MNALVSSAILGGVATGAAAFNVRALEPTPEDWWLRARKQLRNWYGLAEVKYQLLGELEATLQRRAVHDNGESPKYKGYPATGTVESLSTLVQRWLDVFPLWGSALADTEVPSEYLALKSNEDIAQVRRVAEWSPSSPATLEQAHACWRAVGDLAAAADRVRFGDVKTGVTGNHPDGLFDYAEEYYSKGADFFVDGFTAVPKAALGLVDDAAKGIVGSLGVGKTLLLAGGIVVAAFVAWEVLQRVKVIPVPL